jgi:hypothetical protein
MIMRGKKFMRNKSTENLGSMHVQENMDTVENWKSRHRI